MPTYRNGVWYDGTAFVPRTVVVGSPDDDVDLDGGYVVPPFGDAHTHWLEPDLLGVYVAEHLRAGVCYVRDLTNAPGLRERLGGPGSVEYASAHAGFTRPDGHPATLFARLAGLGVVPAHWADTGGVGESVNAVATGADVDRVWPGFVATRPDVVKVFLGPKGLPPDLAAYVVRRATAEGLPTAAHVETAGDVHVAVAIGVAELAHLPFAPPYRIDDADLRPVRVSTTTEWLEETPEGVAPTRDNIVRLRRADATVTVGSDLFRTTAVGEADRLHRLGLLDPPDLLRSWCVDTCAELRGDADFLVLGGDPLADWSAVRDVRLLVKDGAVVAPGPETFPPLPA